MEAGRVELTEARLAAIQAELRAEGLEAWLLHDFRGNNPIATGVLGLPALSRRWFVLLPAEGRPIALTHRIEQQGWEGWIGENRIYLGWAHLQEELLKLLRGRELVAMEYSAGDAIPYLDRIPGGLLDLIRSAGVRPISSGELVSTFYSRWSPEQVASHRRAAAAVQGSALAAFARIGEAIRSGEGIGEWGLRSWILEELKRRGAGVEADAVVARGAHAALPHFAPSASDDAIIEPGEIVLIDLWGKESPEGIFADQTWMAYVGSEPPARALDLWAAIREARDAAVDFLHRRFQAGQESAGYEVDRVARALLAERGLADAFVHRTGHSIDRELHGSGPNLDDLETRDVRRLIPGVGFSVEPGVYFEGEIGMRTEINVWMGPAGPEVTTPDPQIELYRIEV